LWAIVDYERSKASTGIRKQSKSNLVSVHMAQYLLCCRALEVQGVRLRTRTPHICKHPVNAYSSVGCAVKRAL